MIYDTCLGLIKSAVARRCRQRPRHSDEAGSNGISIQQWTTSAIGFSAFCAMPLVWEASLDLRLRWTYYKKTNVRHGRACFHGSEGVFMESGRLVSGCFQASNRKGRGIFDQTKMTGTMSVRSHGIVTEAAMNSVYKWPHCRYTESSECSGRHFPFIMSPIHPGMKP